MIQNRDAYLILLASLFVHLSIPLSAQQPPQAKTKPEGTPIIQIRATSDMDADIGAGGLDIRIKGGTFYQPELCVCTSPIVDLAKKWADLNKLFIIKQDISNTGVTLQMANPKEQGFFELIYRVKLKDKIAALTLSYFTSNGTPVLPEFVNAKGLDDFQVNLTKAVTCTANQGKPSS